MLSTYDAFVEIQDDLQSQIIDDVSGIDLDRNGEFPDGALDELFDFETMQDTRDQIQRAIDALVESLDALEHVLDSLDA